MDSVPARRRSAVAGSWPIAEPRVANACPRERKHVLERLKRRREFVRVTRLRRQNVTPGLILQAAPRAAADNGGAPMRVGFTASRKVGGAVVRNRAKRRLRALAERILPAHAMAGHDYVLIARGTTPARDFDALAHDLETSLKRLHLYKVAEANSGQGKKD